MHVKSSRILPHFKILKNSSKFIVLLALAFKFEQSCICGSITYILYIIVLKTSQFKTVCKDDSGSITQILKQQKSKRWYYLAAHRHTVSVLTSNITFLNFAVLVVW